MDITSETGLDDTPEPIRSRRRSPVPWLVGGFLLALSAFLVIDAIVAADSDLPAGDPPPEVSFDLLGGGTSSFADHRGTPTVVNFFASWGAPCIRELPDMQEAAERYAGRIDVVGLSVSDRVADTEALLAATGVTFPVGLDPNGTIHREVSELGVMPTTLFIAADGTLLSVQPGSISAENLDERIRTELLAGEANP